MLIKGTCSIVTGGASGIGREFAELLVNKGGKVIVGDTDEELGNKEAEISDKEFGGAQTIFNNAGRNEPMDTLSSAEKVTSVSDILLASVVQGCVLANSHFQEQLPKDLTKKFCIINILSIIAKEGLPNIPIYTLAKISAKYWAQLLAQLNWKNTRVNAIKPSYTSRTNILKTEEGIDKSHILEAAYGKLLTPEYMAPKIVELVEVDNLNGVVRFANPFEVHGAGPLGKMTTDRIGYNNN